MSKTPVVVIDKGLVEYTQALEEMHSFTNNRDATTTDEIWLLEHPKVFTQGQAGKDEHVLAAGDIPVVQADRGGQVTYHGPGQLVAYMMLDIKRLDIGVRSLVTALENALIALLEGHQIEAFARADAPGVYVASGKIASLGLRVRNGRSLHGLALNMNLDLEPFARINPCGLAGQPMARLSDISSLWSQSSEQEAKQQCKQQLIDQLCAQLSLQQKA